MSSGDTNCFAYSDGRHKNAGENNNFKAAMLEENQTKQDMAEEDKARIAEETKRTCYLRSLEARFPHRMEEQHYYRGMMLNALVPAERLEELEQFVVRPDDVIVSGYPKSGTTWLEEIIFLIENDGDIAKSNAMPVYVRVPYLEGKYDRKMLDNLPPPRVYKSHLPYSALPEGVFQSCTKIVHIMRNPRDTAVSYFHFYRSLAELGRFQGSWSEFLDMFMAGYVCFGDWFTYVKGWWSQRHQPNVMIITYENLKKHPHAVIASLAKFCNKNLDEDTIERIVQHTTFDNMKDNQMLNFKGVPTIDDSISPFMRKGQVGDWKNYFTLAQNEKFEQLYQERFCDVEGLNFNL